MKKHFWILPFLLFTLHQIVSAQSADSSEWAPRWLEKKEGFKIDVKAMVQLWSIYSTDFEVFNTISNIYEPIDDRFNVSLRRARVVFSGEPYPRLQYTVALFYDQIGRDLLSSGIGVTNRADPAVGIWDAFFQWKATPKNEAVNIVAGWFRPQIQRESITSAWAVNSFEKSMSQNYVRNQLVGTGPGRAGGINFGGLINGKKMGILYNLGLFNPVTTGFSASSSGKEFSPLLAGRLVLTLGDPEMQKYGISYETNFFNRRKGLSIDFNAATQGRTDQFASARTVGAGFLLNYGRLNLDGEWFWMARGGERSNAGGQPGFTTRSQTGHIRAGFNIPAGRFVLEPTVMAMHFQGPMSPQGQTNAAAVKSSAGNETTYDLGMNWYLDRKNLRLMLHYTFRDGNPGAAGDGATVNAFFSQNGVGAIRRGNWLGLGLNAIF